MIRIDKHRLLTGFTGMLHFVCIILCDFSLQRFHTLIVPVYLTFFKGLNLKKKKGK